MYADAISKSIQLARSGSKKQAVAQLLDVLRRDKKQPEAWYWLGLLTDDPAKKLECFQRALELRPDDERAKAEIQKLQPTKPPTAPLRRLTTTEVLPAKPPAPTVDFLNLDDADDENPFMDEPDVNFDDFLAQQRVAPAARNVKTASTELPAIKLPVPTVEPVARVSKPGRDDTLNIDLDDFLLPPVTPVAPKVRAASSELPAIKPPVPPVEPVARVSAAEGISKPKRDDFGGISHAWLAALLFNSRRSYDAYRSRATPLTATIILEVVFLVVPLLVGFFLLAIGDNLSVLSSSNALRVILLFSLGNLIISTVTLLANYVASHATAYVAREQFNSTVSGDEHYALTSLYFAPLYIVSAILLVIVSLIIRVMPTYNLYRLSAFSSIFATLMPATLSITLMIYLIYVIAQYVFSNVAIHRVRALPGFLLSVLFLGLQLLTTAWLMPFVLAFIGQLNQ